MRGDRRTMEERERFLARVARVGPEPFMGDASFQFHANEARTCRGGLTPCVVCGRGIQPGREAGWVRVDMGQNVFVAHGAGVPEAAEGGGWPVGAECLRKYRAALAPYLGE